jgi:2-C-methyl-D-erythritol 4-phosphate cytidylyltransferase / 2-C-methyl-D-erythritol 2,4-cyclodiphosphate synthase
MPAQGLKLRNLTGRQRKIMKRIEPMRTALILVAAGRGTRAGGEQPKQYQNIAGVVLARRALEPFLSSSAVARIVVVISNEDQELADLAFHDVLNRVQFVNGGATRQHSVMNGLQALESDTNRVLIHDAARPFVKPAEIKALLALPLEVSATLATPIADSIRRASSNSSEPVSRDGLYAVQTPQMFPFQAFFAAHNAAQAQSRFNFTDDCSLMQWHGKDITIVAGSKDNFKITLPEDFARAKIMLNTHTPMPDVRVGQGYDIHSHCPGDYVTLCGVKIPHTRGLDGHSDADVGLHALTDALLATIGAGDIGTHFPPSDPQWRGAASRIFLEHAAKLVRAKGGTITLADVTLICEEPKIGPHREAMTAITAETLQIEPFRVSVKATTNERIGAIGRKEGICALASATVVFAPKHGG